MRTKKILSNFSEKLFGPSNYLMWGVLVGVTIVFSIIVIPNLITQKNNYKIGDVAERDIKAPQDFFIENEKETEANIRRAVEKVLTVYDYDDTMSPRLIKKVEEAFVEMRQVYEPKTGLLPPNDLPDLWRLKHLDKKARQIPVEDRLWAQKEFFEELMGFPVSNGAFNLLVKEKFSEEIEGYISKILKEILDNGVAANKDLLLDEKDKGVVLRSVSSKTERVVMELRQFYGLDQAKAMVRIIGHPLMLDVNYNLKNLVVDFVQSLIQPNITLNRHETEERKKKAEENIKPVLYKIKAGEMLLREGERVTDVQLKKLKALQAQAKDKDILPVSIGTVAILIAYLLCFYYLHIEPAQRLRKHYQKNLLFLAAMFIGFLILAKLSFGTGRESLSASSAFSMPGESISYFIPMAAGAMTVCLFLGIEAAVPFALMTSICTAIIYDNRFDFFLYFFLSGAMGAYWMRSCRERQVFIRAGLKLGILQAVFVTALDLYTADYAGVKVAWDVLFAVLGGITAGVVTAGITPLIEVAFDYTTDIKLLELSNLDQPILRQLMLEAPGTYHHSVIVGTMVEAAASEIGANPLLAKVCGYYHDIGKINKPLYFIENQRGGKNRHDKLAPSMSALILIAHVKDGVETARKHKLGEVIMDTIKQHHGTSLISYFYNKAVQLKGVENVNIDDYRYPGPKPQTREAGLVMLADIVEASARTLENPTPSKIQGHVQKIVNKVFSDNQLDNCELTLKDLHNIAKSFNKILSGIYHHRIEYKTIEEKQASVVSMKKVNGKVKNGGSDSKQTGKTRDLPENPKKESPSHLKRLGQS